MVERGQPIPETWIREWAESTGRDPDAAVRDEGQFKAVRYDYKGVSVLGAANHDQFLCRKSVMVDCLPDHWSGQLMGQMIELDRAVDAAGHLRLATAERTTQHMGNAISPALAEQLPDSLDLSGAIMPGARRSEQSASAWP